ncbi:hypothetical protein ACWEPC_24570 [Nonomuraea sp. NPDC004297]
MAAEKRYRRSEEVDGLRTATRELIVSAQEYLREIEKHVEHLSLASSSALIDAQETLVDALRRCNEAHTPVFGQNMLPLSSRKASSDNSSSINVDDAGEKIMSILSRIDYRIDSLDELVEEGRSSYLRENSGATYSEAETAVGSVGDALYEILHGNGDLVPFPFPAAVPIAGITWFVETTQALSQDLNKSPDIPFGVAEEDGRLLFSHRDIFLLSHEADDGQDGNPAT